MELGSGLDDRRLELGLEDGRTELGLGLESGGTDFEEESIKRHGLVDGGGGGGQEGFQPHITIS